MKELMIIRGMLMTISALAITSSNWRRFQEDLKRSAQNNGLITPEDKARLDAELEADHADALARMEREQGAEGG